MFREELRWTTKVKIRLEDFYVLRRAGRNNYGNNEFGTFLFSEKSWKEQIR
jgi:hypothetical protein